MKFYRIVAFHCSANNPNGSLSEFLPPDDAASNKCERFCLRANNKLSPSKSLFLRCLVIRPKTKSLTFIASCIVRREE
jgi:hypothetical protein